MWFWPFYIAEKLTLFLQRFHFRTRKQELNLADGGMFQLSDPCQEPSSPILGTRANLNYLDQLAKFHKQRTGTNLNRFPSVDKRPLDLYKLKKYVEDKGGFDLVCKGKRWAEIGRDLGYSGKIMSSLSTSLKNSYQKWLQPYEEWLKQNKPSVLQQQERENGGPYTPSPAATPLKATLSPKNLDNTSPAIRASAALNASLQDPPSITKPENIAPRSVSGFTAVNSGGFTAVNSPGFSAINAANGYASNGHSTPRQESPAVSSRNTPDNRSLAGPSFGRPVNGESLNGIKRQHSTDGEENVDTDDSGRKSKRLRKGKSHICLSFERSYLPPSSKD